MTAEQGSDPARTAGQRVPRMAVPDASAALATEAMHSVRGERRVELHQDGSPRVFDWGAGDGVCGASVSMERAISALCEALVDAAPGTSGEVRECALTMNANLAALRTVGRGYRRENSVSWVEA